MLDCSGDITQRHLQTYQYPLGTEQCIRNGPIMYAGQLFNSYCTYQVVTITQSCTMQPSKAPTLRTSTRSAGGLKDWMITGLRSRGPSSSWLKLLTFRSWHNCSWRSYRVVTSLQSHHIILHQHTSITCCLPETTKTYLVVRNVEAKLYTFASSSVSCCRVGTDDIGMANQSKLDTLSC